VFITLTTSHPNAEQSKKMEVFLSQFFPRLEKQPGVVAVYHFIRSDLGNDITIIIWDSPEAMKQYRESSIFQEAMAFENELGAPAERSVYPLVYPAPAGL
jgi:heme-degrading monooxygenase HmoA